MLSFSFMFSDFLNLVKNAYLCMNMTTQIQPSLQILPEFPIYFLLGMLQIFGLVIKFSAQVTTHVMILVSDFSKLCSIGLLLFYFICFNLFHMQKFIVFLLLSFLLQRRQQTDKLGFQEICYNNPICYQKCFFLLYTKVVLMAISQSQ